MTPLEQLIREHIRNRGPIPVSAYMDLALSHPDYGYYRGSDPLGRAGDFITAPEISQVFGEIIGLWCAVTWQQAGAPTPFHLVELGPGRGTLMADALHACLAVPEFLAAAGIHLVETSPVLRKLQREKLDGHDATWHAAIDTVPDGPALFVANEFFDALPVDQYVMTDGGWVKRCVGIDPSTDRLAFVVDDAPVATDELIPPSIAAAPEGSVFEHCPSGLEMAAVLGGRLGRDGIAALIIDYGHTSSDIGETLQAVRKHRYHDVLTRPGEADLTAHVDFAALAAAAVSDRVASFGPVTQGCFLSKLGIEARADSLVKNRQGPQADLLRSGCRRLIDARGMGTLFKMLALANGTLGVPAGFESSKENANLPGRERDNAFQ